MKIEFKRSKDLLLFTHEGLSSVGALVQHTQLNKRLNQTRFEGMKVPIHSHSDVMKSYIGLLCQGKSDFDQIEPFRDDDVFSLFMKIRKVPSSPTLRQRLDLAAEKADWGKVLLEESTALIRYFQA